MIFFRLNIDSIDVLIQWCINYDNENKDYNRRKLINNIIKLYHLKRKLSCYLFNYILQQQQKTFQIGIHEFQSKFFYSNLSLALAKFV